MPELKFKPGDRVHYVGEYFPQHREGEWIVTSAHPSVTHGGIYYLKKEHGYNRQNVSAYESELLSAEQKSGC